MMALADAADKENSLSVTTTPGALQSPLVLAGNVSASSKPKKKTSANGARVRSQAWRADKIVQLSIDSKIITDVDDLKGLEAHIKQHQDMVSREQQTKQAQTLAIISIKNQQQQQENLRQQQAKLDTEKAEWRARWEQKEAALQKRDDDVSGKCYASHTGGGR